jgi:TPR repeat protein
MNPDKATCYEILGLPLNSSLQEVKKARRLLARKWHPDLHHNSPKLRREGEEKLKRINGAHDILESILRSSNFTEPTREARKKTQQEEEDDRKANEAREREENRARAERETKRNAKRKEKARGRQLRKTFSKFHRLAKRGIAEAQYRLAMLYRNGHGCVRNKTEALRWFKKAAVAGNPQAMLYLGFAFAWGIDVAAEFSKAIKLYEAAAEKGYAEAYFHLGFMYYFGLGVKQEFESAAKLYCKAIEQGYKVSNQIIDTCGHLRTETPKEYFKHYQWYVLGVKDAKFE